jgi:hypothetical protein
MDSAGFNGHQETEPFNPAATNVPRFTEALTDGTGTAVARFPALCSATGVVGKHSCGNSYTVNGLMNMYDEYAQQEFGTHQELWFQFYYKYQWTSSVQGDAAEFHSDSTDVYNYPNKLFNAFEIVSIAGSCDTTNLQAWNKNRCTGGDTTDSRVHETWSENVQSGR